MPIGASKVGALGGLVPGGSVTFNTSGTWDVPPGVKVVSITGVGGTGTPGNSGTDGNAGTLGFGGTAGGGGSGLQNPGSRVSGGTGGGVWTGTCGCIKTSSASGGAGGSSSPIQGSSGNTGVAGQAGQAGQCGQVGQCGQASSGLGNTFPGGAGGNAGAAGNAGTGGGGGPAGGGGTGTASPNIFNPTPGGSGGTGGGAGGDGGNFPGGPQNFGGAGGGGAGATNSGNNGMQNAQRSNPPAGSHPSVNTGRAGVGGETSGFSFPTRNIDGNNYWPIATYYPPGPSWGTSSPLFVNVSGGAGTRQVVAAPPVQYPGLISIAQCGSGTSQVAFRAAPGIPCAPTPAAVFQLPTNNNANRSGGGGGSGAVGTQYSGGGGGGGGRGNVGGAGGLGGAGGNGVVATPATFNCVPVTPGSSYPITVGGPTGGQVVISWNPQ